MKELFRKYLEGSITPEELELLFEHYSDPSYRDDLATVVQSEFELSKGLSDTSSKLPFFFADLDRQTLDKVKVRIAKTQKWQRQRRIVLIRIASAAAVLLLLVVTSVFMSQTQSPRGTRLIDTTGIEPGGNHAFVTLEDGKRIDLDSRHTGVRVTSDGLEYEDGERVVGSGSTGYARLETPRGGQYRLVLPDGSQVWLNAASSLYYPLRFGQHTREVELDGEAFFEVVPDASRPFLVKSRGQQIEVLGTAFNVNAYASEQKIATTLVEGKIHVESLDGAFRQVLNPGQQAQYTERGLSIASVDPTEFVAWREGLIMFHSNNLPEIIAQLERWYDVEFDEIPVGIASTRVFGMVHRSVPLSDLLKILSDNYDNIQFEIHGRRVTMNVR